MGFSFTALTVLVLSPTIHCQVSGITLNPTTLTLTNNQVYGTVVIICQPPAEANIKSLLLLSIKRSTNSIVDQNVGSYEKGDSAPTVNPIINGATITGGGASNSITVTMSQASCTDAGVYTCDVTFTDTQGSGHSPSSSDNLTVNASPGQIVLTPDPLFSIYPIGSNLTLSCNGRIGSEVVQWVWEYKDPGAGWSAYIPQSENDISTDPPLSIQNSCQRNQESRLIRVITTDDDGRTYRCYVRRGSLNFDQYAAEYLIQKVGSQGPTSAASTSKGPTSAPNTSKGYINPGTTTVDNYTDHLNNFSSGLAVGIGCTLAVVIIIIIAALVWMWRLGWVLPCAKTVTKKPDSSERTFSHMVNYGLAEESQIYISQGLAGNDGTYDELKTCEIGQAAPYSKWQSTESK